MTKTRLEAFSDGVIAILITIMVLELKVPHGTSWEELHPAVFTLLLYAMSYIYIGIYWSNHHHMLHATQHINGSVLWANLHLLFWLSLVPFITGWVGEHHEAVLPTALQTGLSSGSRPRFGSMLPARRFPARRRRIFSIPPATFWRESAGTERRRACNSGAERQLQTWRDGARNAVSPRAISGNMPRNTPEDRCEPAEHSA